MLNKEIFTSGAIFGEFTIIEVFLGLKLLCCLSTRKTYPSDSGIPHMGRNATIYTQYRKGLFIFYIPKSLLHVNNNKKKIGFQPLTTASSVLCTSGLGCKCLRGCIDLEDDNIALISSVDIQPAR